MSNDSAARDHPANSRFILEQDGATAELLYETEPGRVFLVHTEVPEALGGRGIGGQLQRLLWITRGQSTSPSYPGARS